MASGTLGAAALTANTDSTIYTVPVGKVATVNVAICNRSSDPNSVVTVNVGVTKTTLTDESWLEYGVELPPNGILERSAIVIGEGEKIMVRTNGDSVTARVHGFEEGA